MGEQFEGEEVMSPTIFLPNHGCKERMRLIMQVISLCLSGDG